MTKLTDTRVNKKKRNRKKERNESHARLSCFKELFKDLTKLHKERHKINRQNYINRMVVIVLNREKGLFLIEVKFHILR